MTGPQDGAESVATGSDDPLIFPVGHYLGPFHPKRNQPPRHHIVRVGWDTPKLTDEAHVDIWALAHGLPDRVDAVRWTRQAILDAAQDAGMPDAAVILDDLAGLGLITEVHTGTDQALDFAKGHRMQSLLIGLGNSPEDPVLDGIGLAGMAPILKVRPRVFQVWQWAHLWPTVWAACEGLAFVAGETGAGRPEDTDPVTVLDFMLEALRTLVSRNAAYLDLAVTPGDRRAR